MGWEKQRFLGAGSYGRVHLAVEPAGKMEMAVKSADIKNSGSLIREGTFLNVLRDCPYILRCFGDDRSVEHGERVYNLLLEYAPGGTLYNLIKVYGGSIPEMAVARYTYQLLRGIHYLHSNEIIHCDLKPGNVLVFPGQFSGEIRLKICDFGLAKFSEEDNVYGDCHRGTLLYAPPESLTCPRSYTAAKDIWALGCTVVEMLTGKPIWQTGNKHELAMKIALNNPEIPDHITFWAGHFLNMCLNRDPRRRWTAEMLLRHPFVQRFTVVEREQDQGFVNPLGCTEFRTSKDMFTVPHVQLPPEKDQEVAGNRCSVFLYGKETMKQIIGG